MAHVTFAYRFFLNFYLSLQLYYYCRRDRISSPRDFPISRFSWFYHVVSLTMFLWLLIYHILIARSIVRLGLVTWHASIHTLLCLQIFKLSRLWSVAIFPSWVLMICAMTLVILDAFLVLLWQYIQGSSFISYPGPGLCRSPRSLSFFRTNCLSGVLIAAELDIFF